MKPSFFENNRQKLIERTKADLVVIAGNVAMQRSNDMAYPFQQESNFWYLTGINEADWWMILEPHKTTLVAPDIDETHRIFDGGISSEMAISISGADEVLTNTAGEALLLKLDILETVYTLGDDPHEDHYDFTLNPGQVEMYDHLQDVFVEIKDCRAILSRLRAIKQPEEIAAIKRAVALTVDAFSDIRQRIDDFTYEHEVEAAFSHHFRSHGATGHAYDPIVAGGSHACTLHYIKNDSVLRDGDVILMDVGASVDGYAADITRTYAKGIVSERFTDIHLEVEKAHKKIISLLKPGLVVKEYIAEVDVIMKSALTNLGLLKDEKDYRVYFPHSISHGLGIDVHDSLGNPDTFKPGMILTVEPGIYIFEEGIGVRIEDDILITESGHENLSEMLPTSL